MRFSLFCVFVLLFAACQTDNYTPKPRAFPRIDFPKGDWKQLEVNGCPFEMEIPAYAEIVRDSSLFGERPPHECWFDLYYPSLDGKVHFSYLPTNGAKSFDELRTDAFKMAGWHNRKANYIDEQLIDTPHGVQGLSFRMEGPVASPFQFFVTDSLRNHFLRGSVYVQAKVDVDSLAPVYDFILKDLDRVVESVRWE